MDKAVLRIGISGPLGRGFLSCEDGLSVNGEPVAVVKAKTEGHKILFERLQYELQLLTTEKLNDVVELLEKTGSIALG